MKNLIEYITEHMFSGKKISLKEQDKYKTVDLGLPSGIKWATCNVGATKPEEYGDYFAWGETKPKKEYTEDNYTFTDKPNVLSKENDAAYQTTHGILRMPTKVEFEELFKHSDNDYYELNGIKGRKFVSKKDDSKWIFIPFSGFCDSSNGGGVGDEFYLWSSSLSPADPRRVSIGSGDYDTAYMGNSFRSYGFSVRGVQNKK